MCFRFVVNYWSGLWHWVCHYNWWCFLGFLGSSNVSCPCMSSQGSVDGSSQSNPSRASALFLEVQLAVVSACRSSMKSSRGMVWPGMDFDHSLRNTFWTGRVLNGIVTWLSQISSRITYRSLQSVCFLTRSARCLTLHNGWTIGFKSIGISMICSKPMRCTWQSPNSYDGAWKAVSQFLAEAFKFWKYPTPQTPCETPWGKICWRRYQHR